MPRGLKVSGCDLCSLNLGPNPGAVERALEYDFRGRASAVEGALLTTSDNLIFCVDCVEGDDWAGGLSCRSADGKAKRSPGNWGLPKGDSIL